MPILSKKVRNRTPLPKSVVEVNQWHLLEVHELASLNIGNVGINKSAGKGELFVKAVED
jgi:hypothetical protein